MESNGEKTSRRDVLKLGAYGLGAISAMSVGSSAKAQVATKAVMRQQPPKDGKQCIGCQHYEVLTSRRTADGEISATGYCSLFAKKPA
jgi:anaerobic selenocysteine-containing dehydrogenase